MNLKPVFDLIERCHTGLSDLFPHEGVKAIGGSRMFISSPFFSVLKDCMKDMRKALEQWGDAEARNTLDSLYAEMAGLLIRMEKESGQHESDRIDEAATLLYLANGSAWNYLRGFVADEPPHNPQYVRVEPMLLLLKRCGWRVGLEQSVDPTQLLQQFCVELNACLR